MEKYHTARQVTDDATVQHTHTAFFMPIAIDTDTKHVILIAFASDDSYTNTP